MLVIKDFNRLIVTTDLKLRPVKRSRIEGGCAGPVSVWDLVLVVLEHVVGFAPVSKKQRI